VDNWDVKDWLIDEIKHDYPKKCNECGKMYGIKDGVEIYIRPTSVSGGSIQYQCACKWMKKDE
jgi:hypothetical protein